MLADHLNLKTREAVPEDVRLREAATLAPYATFSTQSAGRVYREAIAAQVGPFELDRDRILQSVAFRRLGGKTQVFTSDWGDDHRTRLTHTQEVSAVARSIGMRLRLNGMLIEALSLAHDLGHPPLGHAGEKVLDTCLRPWGGFNHNRQGLRILERLELCQAGFAGLNLTAEVLAGQQSRAERQCKGTGASLEAQVVEAADSAVYDTHDADDALRLGFLDLGELLEVPLWNAAARRVRRRTQCLDQADLRQVVLQELLQWQSQDLIASLEAQTKNAVTSLSIGPSSELTELKIDFERMMYERVYRHPQLLRALDRAGQKLQELFELLSRRPELLLGEFQPEAGEEVARGIGDYLSGLTDRSLEQTYAALCGGAEPPWGRRQRRAA
jgi:dGTPase